MYMITTQKTNLNNQHYENLKDLKVVVPIHAS